MWALMIVVACVFVVCVIAFIHGASPGRAGGGTILEIDRPDEQPTRRHAT